MQRCKHCVRFVLAIFGRFLFSIHFIHSDFLLLHLIHTSAVEVSFNENSYTVAESDGQVSVSLRIDGQFFVPMWAVVEIGDGTATGGLCTVALYIRAIYEPAPSHIHVIPRLLQFNH